MESFSGSNQYEGNQFEAYRVLKSYLESIVSKEKSEDKAVILNRLLSLFENLENSVLTPDKDVELFIKKLFKDQFEELVANLIPYYQQVIVNDIETQIQEIETHTANKAEASNIKSKEQLEDALAKSLFGSKIELADSLTNSQIEYLLLNTIEREEFLYVLESIVKITNLPKVKNKPLEIKHLTSLINHRIIDFQGTMKPTKTINSKSFVNISNCVEAYISSKDRFIFEIVNLQYLDNSYLYQLNIKVLGDPPYKHD